MYIVRRRNEVINTCLKSKISRRDRFSSLNHHEQCHGYTPERQPSKASNVNGPDSGIQTALYRIPCDDAPTIVPLLLDHEQFYTSNPHTPSALLQFHLLHPGDAGQVEAFYCRLIRHLV